MRRVTLLTCIVLFGGLIAAPAVIAQEAEEPDPVVHMAQYQIPWERVDSLRTLLANYPQWVEKAREMGHILDRQFWIHLQGDEWNVVIVTSYASWDAWANRKPGWVGEAFRAVEPDSTRRAAQNAGSRWVFQGTIHKDNIYRRSYP
jgi:hypothetical protein